MSYNITIEGGKSARLPTAGKYCSKDIVITATGGGGDEEWIGDGNTHIWITLSEGRTSPMLGVCPKGTVTVDWGDGTTPDVLTGTSTSTVKWTPTHEYAEPGDYVITLIVDGEMSFSGSSYSNERAYILRHTSDKDARNLAYQNTVQKIEIGSGVTSTGHSAFNGCQSLTSIAIPDSVTSIGNNIFYQCYSLNSIAIPDSVTSIGNYAFYYCESLASITIPDNVTKIGENAFRSCYSLVSVAIPGGVASISKNTFYGCSGVRYYDFSNHTAVPTLVNANAFTDISADCEIRVPAALYDEWIAATNWSTYASNIIAVQGGVIA